MCGFTRRVNNQNRSAGCESIFLCAVNWNEAAEAWCALRRGSAPKLLLTEAAALLPWLILPLVGARWLLKASGDDHAAVPVVVCVCLFCPGETQLVEGNCPG